MKLNFGSKKVPVTFTDVLCVLDLGTNLIWCGELGLACIRCVLNAQECRLEDSSAHRKIIRRAIRELGGFYILSGKLNSAVYDAAI